MKKLLCLLLVAVLCSVGVYLHGRIAKLFKNEVVVYNWSDYIPQSVLNDFTKETGINVIYSTYESNESMFSKLQLLGNGGHGYDIVVPSTYYINMLREKDLIQEHPCQYRLYRRGNIFVG